MASQNGMARGQNLAKAGALAKVHKIEPSIQAPLLFGPFAFRKNFMARLVNCIKLGAQAEGLDLPPYPGPLGKRIWEEVSKAAWAEWMKQQTMLVNENRLNLADARARQYLARQMEKHFFGDGADAVAGYVPPST
jgi:Fe-S cluster biosynthesis and repair protein YggX